MRIGILSEPCSLIASKDNRLAMAAFRNLMSGVSTPALFSTINALVGERSSCTTSLLSTSQD